MFVRFKTSSAGPDPAKNWSSGEVRDVDDDLAKQLIADRIADECGAPKGRIFAAADLSVLYERQQREIKELQEAVQLLVTGQKPDPSSWRKTLGW